jgi:GPH family glycoside/pentoside/hexuronide:cation symporter
MVEGTSSAALTQRTKLAYGVGQVTRGVKDVSFHFYIFFYYSQVLGMSGKLAGLAAFVALCFDAVSDPLVGHISDNLRSQRWGRRHGFILASAVPFGLSLFMLFRPPEAASEQGLFLWYVVWAVIVRTIMTLFDVPHLSLGAELSEDYQERTRVVSYRTFFQYAGALALHVVAFTMFFPQASGGLLHAAGYQSFGNLAAIVSVTVILITFLGTRERIPHLSKAPAKEDATPWWHAFREMLLVIRLRSVKVFMLSALVIAVVGGLANTLTFHVSTYFWALTAEQILGILLSTSVAVIPASLLAPWVSDRLDKRPALMLFMVIYASVGTAPIFGRLLGWMPENGTQELYALVLGFHVLSQTFIIGSLIVVGSMIADMVDEHELITHKRQEGLFFAALSFMHKCSFGLGSLLAGVGIDAIGFPKQAAVGEVGADALRGLGMIMGPGVFVLALLSASILVGYRLDAAAHRQIRQQLEENRAAT